MGAVFKYTVAELYFIKQTSFFWAQLQMCLQGKYYTHSNESNVPENNLY